MPDIMLERNPNVSGGLGASAKNKANTAQLELELGKNHPIVPPFDHFQGKNKNCSSFALPN